MKKVGMARWRWNGFLPADPACGSGLCFEADLVANRVGQTFQQATVLGKDTDYLGNLRLDAREPFICLALNLYLTPFELGVSAVRFGQASNKCRLVLDECGHRIFEPIVAVP
jgi:hypothetical protein